MHCFDSSWEFLKVPGLFLDILYINICNICILYLIIIVSFVSIVLLALNLEHRCWFQTPRPPFITFGSFSNPPPPRLLGFLNFSNPPSIRHLRVLGIKNDCSTGDDGIPIHYIKPVLHDITSPMVNIINNCIDKNVFPTCNLDLVM